MLTLERERLPVHYWYYIDDDFVGSFNIGNRIKFWHIYICTSLKLYPELYQITTLLKMSTRMDLKLYQTYIRSAPEWNKNFTGIELKV